jgi:GT2 family glycosyltransferase
MTSQHPTISVVIPAFRCADSIVDVLAALHAQTLKVTEVILVDDCSPDGLENILGAMRDGLVYLRNEHNQGLSKSYNRGIHAATSEYLLTLHSDCILAPDYIQHLWASLSCDRRVGAVTGRLHLRDFDTAPFCDQLFAVLNHLGPSPDHREAMDEVAFVEGKADLFRRPQLVEMNCFSEDLVLTAEDQDLSARYRLRGFSLLQNNKAVYQLRQNGTQDSVAKVLRKQFTYAKGQAYILLQYKSLAFRRTTRDRDLRALHRGSQVVTTLAYIATIAGSSWCTPTIYLVGAIVAARAAYYIHLSKNMNLRHCVVTVPLGLFADILYTLGLAYGSACFYIKRGSRHQ